MRVWSTEASGSNIGMRADELFLDVFWQLFFTVSKLLRAIRPDKKDLPYSSNSNLNDAYAHPRPWRDLQDTNRRCSEMMVCEEMMDVIWLSKNIFKSKTESET